MRCHRNSLITGREHKLVTPCKESSRPTLRTRGGKGSWSREIQIQLFPWSPSRTFKTRLSSGTMDPNGERTGQRGIKESSSEDKHITNIPGCKRIQVRTIEVSLRFFC